MKPADIQSLLLQWNFKVDQWGGYVKTVPALHKPTGEMRTREVRIVFKDRVIQVFKNESRCKDWVKQTWCYYHEVEHLVEGLRIPNTHAKAVRIFSNEGLIECEKKLKAKADAIVAAMLPPV